MKRGKNLILLALLTLLALPIMAAGNEESGTSVDMEKVFRLNIAQEPSVLDPYQFRDDNATSLMYALHEPLLRISQNSKGWEPGLATEYTVNDEATVYTFKLRQNAKWADGKPITAEDIVYSFQRAIDPGFASPKAFDYYDILNAEEIFTNEAAMSSLGVKAVDDYTVEFTLKRPVDYFLDLILMPGFAPIQKEAGESYKELYGTAVEKIMSSGPFVITEWQHDASITMVKNENYWDAANVNLDKIEVSLIQDSNAVSGMYMVGDLDFMEVNPDYLSMYQGKEDFYTMPQTRVSFIEFNPNVEFLNNIKIREALSIAFNRKSYVDDVLATGDLPAYGMIPPGVRGKDGGDFRAQAGDLVVDAASDPDASIRAARLFQEGLAEIGKTVEDMEAEIEMYCVDAPDHKKRAQAIQQMWKATLGVNILVVPMQVKMLIPLLMM